MQAGSDAPQWGHFLPIAIIVLLVLRRTIRPRRISVKRMWISPIILCTAAVWVVWLHQQHDPAPVLEITLGIAAGLVLGTPFGVLRGRHTDVQMTDKPGVMFLGSSWIASTIYLGAYALRFGIRSLLPQQGSMAAAIGDALLGFACAFIIASCIVIHRKYDLAVAQSTASAP